MSVAATREAGRFLRNHSDQNRAGEPNPQLFDIRLWKEEPGNKDSVQCQIDGVKYEGNSGNSD